MRQPKNPGYQWKAKINEPDIILYTHAYIITSLTKDPMTCRDNAVLTPISKDLFSKERPGDPRVGSWIKTQVPTSNEFHWIVGCPDDTGITLNFGRPGARLGPSEIRRAFYRMALPEIFSQSPAVIVDGGDIKIESTIKNTHHNVASALSNQASKALSVTILGGGHDFAAPAFTGFVKSHRLADPQASFGLINIDPHLDVREFESGDPHSGSPFRQLLESKILLGPNLIQFGCRETRNAASHFDFCKKNLVNLCPLSEIRKNKLSVSNFFQSHLLELASRVSHVGLTIDMDSCSEVSGTSAAPAIGFSITELYEIAEIAGKHPSVRYFEIAEVSPPLDPSGKTQNAAAEILMAFFVGKFHTENF